MDRNLDIDDFERLLKERSEEFKMYPTKRVWHSIYNNIHPGKKWPSIAMSITLIAILLLIGFLNTNNTDTSVAGTPAGYASLNSPSSFLNNNNIYNQNIFYTFANNTTLITSLNKPGNKSINDRSAKDYTPDNNSATGNITPFYSDNKITVAAAAGLKNTTFLSTVQAGENTIAANINASVSGAGLISAIQNTSTGSQTAVTSIQKDKTTTQGQNQVVEFFVRDKNVPDVNDRNEVSNKIIISPLTASPVDENELASLNDDAGKVKKEAVNGAIKTAAINTSINKKEAVIKTIILSDEDKAWVENYALYNRPIPKKWAGKLGWQLYITPSVVYRKLKSVVPADNDINKEVVQHPSIGLEIGAGIIYPVFKGIKIKTGLQLNFTRYNTDAFENSHPVATSITLHDEMGQFYQASRTTPYSNNGGITPLKLHNETYQVSIPMGVDFKLLGNDNLQWNVGATIQPAYVFGGKSYLLSSDKRNYIKESSLLNRWNLDAGFETFISYKVNGFTLQFGPQFRKQIFTTNTKQYTLEEKLNNYGFKFGITKLIK